MKRKSDKTKTVAKTKNEKKNIYFVCSEPEIPIYSNVMDWFRCAYVCVMLRNEKHFMKMF